MKAFKQINYAFENRIVFGYAGLLSILCFMIMLSPVFAQDINHQDDCQPGFESFPDIPHLDRFNYWSVPDSSGYLLDDSTFYNPLFGDSWSVIAPAPFHDFFPNDSLYGSFHHFDDLSKLFDQQIDLDEFLFNDESLKKFRHEQDEFLERFREYQEEHQKLIEKYFHQPDQSDGSYPQNEPSSISRDSKENYS